MTKVLVAEDQALLRGALVEILGREPDFEVVAECATGSEIIPLAIKHQPDVSVLDIDLPELNGLDAAEQLTQAVPNTTILMLTVFGRPGYLRRALANGALSFILKDTPPAQLVEAIRRTAQGERVVDPELAIAALERGDSPLTQRESQVLAASRHLHRTADIARRLSLSEGTVRNLLSSAMQKLHADSRTQAAAIAENHGWI